MPFADIYRIGDVSVRIEIDNQHNKQLQKFDNHENYKLFSPLQHYGNRSFDCYLWCNSRHSWFPTRRNPCYAWIDHAGFYDSTQRYKER